MKKRNKGITLIALVITIIVLLILAGITIAMIAGQDSAPAKAVEARNANKEGEAKDAAALLITGYIQDYYNGKYVGNEAAAKNATDAGAYISAKLANPVTKGEHTFQVADGVLNVSDTSGNPIISGTVNPNGTITWNGEATNVGNSGNSGGSSTVTPTGITVSNTNNVTSLDVGETASFTATITPSGATGTIVWSCSPAGAVTFSPTTGTSTTATGVTAGNVTITATIQGTEISSSGEAITVQEPTPTPGGTKEATSSKAQAINAKIGTNITYTGYPAYINGNYTGGWQVFYATDNEVFIISENLAKTSFSPLQRPNDSNKSAYTGSENVRNSLYNYGANWNSEWIKSCSTESTQNNAKITAYLCDANNWDEYVNDEIATYAVGGPTLELLAKSIDIHENSNYYENIASYAEGYDWIWFNKNIASPYTFSNDTWWIASPSYNGQDMIRSVRYLTHGDFELYVTQQSQKDFIGNIIYYNTYNSAVKSCGIRPLVSIPINKVTVGENTITINS